MTINKSQGQSRQTFKVCQNTFFKGKAYFSHGQLCEASSRISKFQNLHVFAERNKSFNIVHKSVLQEVEKFKNR